MYNQRQIQATNGAIKNNKSAWLQSDCDILYPNVVCFGCSLVSYGVLAFTYVNFKNELYNYTGIASQIVRGDRVESYLNGAEEDRYYEYVDSFLNSMCDEVSLEDLSVITPDDEGIEYLWDTGKSGAGHKRGDRVDWKDIDSKTKENILSACDRNTSDTAPERKMMTDDITMLSFKYNGK